ncbi:protein suppressor 2 of zeste isoform X2 [Anabrus simplex]|uniref:protein suppressor 2 of zeste isoform X2 n=1 Tax=Anabrus simplex TaxID=316456 RepID=UPI0035A2DF19
MMPNKGRLRLTDVNPYLMCVLCGGYLIDATTIVECLHSFCRSCLIKYLEGNSFCPICEVQIHKAKPYRNIKADKALQCIVYKLVPGLYHAEMARRREFYSKHPYQAERTTPEDRGLGLERMIYAPDDKISLSLEYYEASRDTDECDSVSASSHSSVTGEVEVYHKRECLSDELTLMDVAYIYTWKRNGPMEFLYRFYELSRLSTMEDVDMKSHDEVLSSGSASVPQALENFTKDDNIETSLAIEAPVSPQKLECSEVNFKPDSEVSTERVIETLNELIASVFEASGTEGLKETGKSDGDAEADITSSSANSTNDVHGDHSSDTTAAITAESDTAVTEPEVNTNLPQTESSTGANPTLPSDEQQSLPQVDTSEVSNKETKLSESKVEESSPITESSDPSVGVQQSPVEVKNNPVAPESNPSELSSGKVKLHTPVAVKEQSSRISIGLLASLALERRSNSTLSASLSRKRAATDGGSQSDPEKKVRIAPKPIPNLPNSTSSLVLAKNSLNRHPNGQETKVTKQCLPSSIGMSALKDIGTYLPGQLSITPVTVQKTELDNKRKYEEFKSTVELQMKSPQLPPVIETCERPKRPASHMPILQTPPSPSKSVCDQYSAKIASIPRLIEINSVNTSKANSKKNRVVSKRVMKRTDSQKHDGIGALDLSSTTRRSQHTADILAIAQNLARRQQMLAQTSTPTPPLSPLSSLSAFPVPNFVPVRSPPPPLRIPVPPTSTSGFRFQHPHQQRPSSLSSSSPSPPAENGPSSSRSPRVGTSTHDVFSSPGHQGHHLPPPPPPNSTLMYRSRFELQNPWHGEWYNDQLMRRCLESLRRGEGIPSAPYFAYPTSTNSNSNKTTVRK